MVEKDQKTVLFWTNLATWKHCNEASLIACILWYLLFKHKFCNVLLAANYCFLLYVDIGIRIVKVGSKYFANQTTLKYV